MIIPTWISTTSNLDLNDMIVVIEPAPAINGKAIGTKVPDLDSGSSLNKVIPSIISRPMKNKIIAPATANDCKSTPKRESKFSPTYRKTDIISSAIRDALADFISKPLLFRSMIIGMDPTMSITENKTNVIDKMFLKSKLLVVYVLRQM